MSASWVMSVALSSDRRAQVVQWKLMSKFSLSTLAVKICSCVPVVCARMRMTPLLVPSVKVVDVGNPVLGRLGC